MVDADTDCTCLTPQRARSFPTQHNHDTLVSRGSFCSILILLRDVQRDLSAKACVGGESLKRCLSSVLSVPSHLCDCPLGRATLSRPTLCPPGCPLDRWGGSGFTLGELKANWAAVGMFGMDHEPQLLFIGDGVYGLIKDQNIMHIRKFKSTFESFDGRICVSKKSIKERNISPDEIFENVEILSEEDVAKAFVENDIVVTF